MTNKTAWSIIRDAMVQAARIERGGHSNEERSARFDAVAAQAEKAIQALPAVAASGSPPREPTAWLFQHDEGGRQVVIGAIDLRNMRNAKGWNEVGPLYLGAGRSPAEVPPTWKASEEVSAAREAFDKAEDEYVQARQYNEDEEFVIQATAIEATAKLEELLDAVWRSAQPHD